MTVFSWLWIVWGAMFVGVEGAALVIKDRPAAPATLTANVRWLINGAGVWHHTARVILTVLLAWLPFHFGLPGTDWGSVWPNIVASVVWSALFIPGAVKAFRAHQAKLHAAHVQALAEHHESLKQWLREELGRDHAGA